MNTLLQHLEAWERSQKKLIEGAGLSLEIVDDFDNEIGARHIEVEEDDFEAHAVLWEDGFLELTAIDQTSNTFFINRSYNVNEPHELDEHLNAWLAEIAFYKVDDA